MNEKIKIVRAVVFKNIEHWSDYRFWLQGRYIEKNAVFEKPKHLIVEPLAVNWGTIKQIVGDWYIQNDKTCPLCYWSNGRWMAYEPIVKGNKIIRESLQVCVCRLYDFNYISKDYYYDKAGKKRHRDIFLEQQVIERRENFAALDINWIGWTKKIENESFKDD